MLKSGCVWSGCAIRQSDGTCSLNLVDGRAAPIIVERGGGCAAGAVCALGDPGADRLQLLGQVEVRAGLELLRDRQSDRSSLTLGSELAMSSRVYPEHQNSEEIDGEGYLSALIEQVRKLVA